MIAGSAYASAFSRRLGQSCAVALGLAILGLAAASIWLYRPVVFPAHGAAPAPGKVILTQVPVGRTVGRVSEVSQPWDIAGTPGVHALDARQCPGASRQWRDSTPTVWILVVVTRCASLESAREVQWVLNRNFPANFGEMTVTPAVPDAVQGAGGAFKGWPPGKYQIIEYRRGVYCVQIASFAADSRGGDAYSLARSVAKDQWRRIPGAPGTGAESFTALVTDQVPVGAAVLLILIVLIKWAIGGLRNRRRRLKATRRSWVGAVPGVHPVDVTRRSRRARAQAWWAGALWLVTIYCAAAAISADGVNAVLLGAAAVAASGAVVLGMRVRTVFRPSPLQHVVGGQTVRFVAIMGLIEAGLLALALAISLPSASVASRSGRLDPTTVIDNALGRWVATLPLSLAVADSVAFAAAVWAAAWLLSSRARNPSSAATVTAGAERTRNITYLAAAGTKPLTLRTGFTGLQRLAEKPAFQLFERFDAVAARLLSAHGRLLTSSVVPAGLDGDFLLIVDAAPREGGTPAQPELADPRFRKHIDRVLFVFPPLDEQEIYARWETFRARNLQYVPLPVLGEDTGRVLILRCRNATGWYGYHASRKTESGYAVAISEAVRSSGVPAWQHPAASPGREASEPAPRPAAPATSEPGLMPTPAAGQLAPAEPASMRTAPAGTGLGNGNVRTSRWHAHIPLMRLVIAVSIVLFVAVNVLAVQLTTPHAGPVSSAVGQAILPAGALGAGFSVVLPVGTPTVSLSSLQGNGASCTQQSRAWADPARHLRVQIELTGCWPPGIVKITQKRLDELWGSNDAGRFSGIPYSAGMNSTVSIAGTRYEAHRLLFRGGAVLASVEVLGRSAPDSGSSALLRNAARQQLAQLPGPAGPGVGGVSASAIIGPATALYTSGIGLLVLALALGSWISRRRMTARAQSRSPRSSERVMATNVRGRATRLGWLARARLISQAVGVYLIVISTVSHSLAETCTGLVLFIVATAVRPRGAVRPVRERLRAGALTGRRPIAAVSLVLFSLVSAMLVIVLPLAGFLFWSLRNSVFVVAYGRIDPAYMGHGLIRRTLASIPLPVLSADCFVTAAVAAAAIPVSYLAARRIAALSADEIVGSDDDRAILYLRNFSDDDIRMPTSRLSRNSLIERIAVYKFERFEEVLVRHLSTFAPVIAVNSGGVKKPPIGAARMTMSDNEWQDEISDWISRAHMIVVGAAPQRPTEGLSWELQEIARAGALPKVLLVLPPLPLPALRARWPIFRSMATSYDLPDEISVSVDHQLVMASAGDWKWRTWHSRRRSEWDYVVALREAARTVFGPAEDKAAASSGSARQQDSGGASA